MRLIVAALLLSPEAALACSMVAWPPNLGLPGASAGPNAVFTSSEPASVVVGPGATEIGIGARGEVEPCDAALRRVEPSPTS